MEKTILEKIKEIKHLFMTYRNGIVADALRQSGMTYGIIFGLQLPQLSAIGRETGHDNELADALWQDENVRESRLLACWLYDPATLPEEKALELARAIKTREEADILCHRLLRHLPYAADLPAKLTGYVADALHRNLE